MPAIGRSEGEMNGDGVGWGGVGGEREREVRSAMKVGEEVRTRRRGVKKAE